MGRLSEATPRKKKVHMGTSDPHSFSFFFPHFDLILCVSGGEMRHLDPFKVLELRVYGRKTKSNIKVMAICSQMII